MTLDAAPMRPVLRWHGYQQAMADVRRLLGIKE